jgi:hypothetical protein
MDETGRLKTRDAEEKKSRRQQAGWSLLESGPSTAQCRHCRDKRATCRTTTPQSLYSIPSLVPSFWVRMSNNVTRLTWVLQLHQSSLLLLQLHDLLVVCIFSPLAWTVLKPSTKYTAACGRAQWSKVHRTGLQDVEELRHENVDDLCL